MSKMYLCRTCVNPSTRPNMEIDADGICPVCRFESERRNDVVDWAGREAELRALCEWGKAHRRSSYDCIVPVSGGKDSTRQACHVRDELGLNPLLVNCSYPPEQLTELGAHNFSNLISLGFDLISISPDPRLWKRIVRKSFFDNGNWQRGPEMVLYASPIHAAIAYQIPLIFYGENPAFTIGEKASGFDGDASRLKQGNTIAGGPDSLLPPGVERPDAHFYYYPSDDDMDAAQLRLVYLGYYMRDWSGAVNAQFALARGFRKRSEPAEMTGDITAYTCLDEDFSIVNQYFKYLKLGFGRVTDQVCEAINNQGTMSRAEGLEVVKLVDGNCDRSFIRRFCAFAEISEDEFDQNVERFRNRALWSENADGTFRLNVQENA
jgi:N-acetyl sugar amidotransferase